MKALIIEDEPAVVELLKILLERIDIEPEVADYNTAIDWEKYDLVLSDYMLRGAKGTGATFLAECAAVNPSAGRILVTAYTEALPEDIKAHVIITKPFCIRHLERAMEKLAKEDNENISDRR